MTKKRLRQVEKRIERLKQRLESIGEMRPGTLTRQYKNRKEKKGAYYQLSYTHKMKSHTDYVRPENVKRIRKEIGNYKKFKKLITEWIDLGIEHSKIQTQIAKKFKL
ncbi:MAG: hypothetical protein GY834_10870 [Bacteroidetes bacterium]|nr:hypothetical protein [Bacteroidota bacterium]